MKAHIRDCRIGRPTHERPFQRFVTVTADNALSDVWGQDEVTLVLDEEETRKLHRYLSRCLAELEAGCVEVNQGEGEFLSIAPKRETP